MKTTTGAFVGTSVGVKADWRICRDIGWREDHNWRICRDIGWREDHNRRIRGDIGWGEDNNQHCRDIRLGGALHRTY
ncbi:hypothetical protein MASR2M15_29870 [Anaerolineales bacterium]